MKKLVLFLVVMGCILSVSVMAYSGSYHPPISYYGNGNFYPVYRSNSYNPYGYYERYLDQRGYLNPYPLYDPYRIYGQALSAQLDDSDSYIPPLRPYPTLATGSIIQNNPYNQPTRPYPPYPVRPYPILATGQVIQPDPGDSFPWAYYPDSYAQQYYDLDDGEVILKGNSVLPSTVRVKVGDTVSWKSKEGYPHIIKSAYGSSESFDSGSLIFGESFSKQFNQEGTYDYYDPLYPWMHGRVVVSS